MTSWVIENRVLHTSLSRNAFGGLNMHRNTYEYVHSCSGCQLSQPILPYLTNRRLPRTNLFECYFIDFAVHFPVKTFENQYLLITLEHLTGWPIVRTIKTATSDMVKKFLKEDIMFQFGASTRIISDNGSCFTSATLHSFSLEQDITWINILEYAAVSNGRAERMVG